MVTVAAMLTALAVASPPVMYAADGAAADGAGAARGTEVIELARDGHTRYVIVVAQEVAPAESLAASELARYLGAMSGARFAISTRAQRGPVIVVRAVRHDRELRAISAGTVAGDDAYEIAVRGDSLVLNGATGRAVLYAAYDLLERLGCRFIAPDLAFYHGAHELVPRRDVLRYGGAEVRERPVMAYRKIDVESGRSHDVATLGAIIDWMPKARYNILQLPLDFGGGGRVVWDHWRAALLPELDRRQLLIEVGGHGYQNFINGGMEGGTLFDRHPDWFGRDSSCARSRSPRIVFNTANPDATRYVIDGVVRYAHAHPEIDILDFWPPDGARWNACAADSTSGTVADRQSELVDAVHAALVAERPALRLETIAYSETSQPPRLVALDPEVLVDFCPISQSFDAQLFDTTNSVNAEYVSAIRAWREHHAGEISLYSYYRKYAWRSLPVVFPHYIQRDLAWASAQGMRGVSSYAEPADWSTYEVNHYVLGRLAWNPSADVDAIVGALADARYGAASAAAQRALRALEKTEPHFSSIPATTLKSAVAIGGARAGLAARAEELRRASTADSSSAAAVTRLSLALDFAIRDLAIQQQRAAGVASAALVPQVERLVAFLHAHASDGVFLTDTPAADRSRYLRLYGITGS
jgi:hypothetical protein